MKNPILMRGPLNEDQRRDKMQADGIHRVKVTTRIRGTLKEDFFKDSIKRDLREGKLCEMILKIHYVLASEFPSIKALDYEDLNNMEMTQLKKCIIDKVRFK